MQPWDLQLQNAIAVDSEYRVQERDLKGSIASILCVVLFKTFRARRRTLFLELLIESIHTSLST